MKNRRSIQVSFAVPMFFGVLFLLTLINTCQQHEPEVFLRITTDTIETLSSGNYRFIGSVVSFGEEGITQHGFCWSTTNDPTANGLSTKLGARDSKGSFTSTISDLTLSTRYYVRAYAVTDAETVYGEEKSFNTPAPGLPILTTMEVSDKTQTSARSGGVITDDGGAAVTAKGVCWGLSSEPTISDLHTTDGSGTGSFPSIIDGLTPDTKYYVRAYATNSSGTNYGNEKTFTTLETIYTPTVTTTPVTSYTNILAAVGGEVISDGGAPVTESGIYWGTAENPQSSGTKLAISSGIGTFSEELSGLSPGETYHVVAYAENSEGFGYGGIESFTTNTAPSIYQQNSYGGSSEDIGQCVIQTSDGGYALTGYSSSSDGDVSGNHGNRDYWLVKTDASGSISWQNSYGGSGSDLAYSVVQTTDGGYALGGYTSSTNGDISEDKGGNDYWIVKLNSTGSIQWESSFGGSNEDHAHAMIQSSDGGYAMTGYTLSTDGDVTGAHGDYDIWVVKLNSAGELQWQKALGGTGNDKAWSIIQTTDNGYMVAGESNSNDGDVSGNHGDFDLWVVKLNSSGNIQWQKSFGGSGSDGAKSVIQTSDGGYAVAGGSTSEDGDISGTHGGITDLWVIKMNSTGGMQWQNALGGTGREIAYSIIQNSDGGYALAGFSDSWDGDVTGNHLGDDYWVVELNSSGELQWQKSLGGSSADRAFSILETTDKGYACSGYSFSTDGDVSEHNGHFEYWMVILK